MLLIPLKCKDDLTIDLESCTLGYIGDLTHKYFTLNSIAGADYYEYLRRGVNDIIIKIHQFNST